MSRTDHHRKSKRKGWRCNCFICSPAAEKKSEIREKEAKLEIQQIKKEYED